MAKALLFFLLISVPLQAEVVQKKDPQQYCPSFISNEDFPMYRLPILKAKYQKTKKVFRKFINFKFSMYVPKGWNVKDVYNNSEKFVQIKPGKKNACITFEKGESDDWDDKHCSSFSITEFSAVTDNYDFDLHASEAIKNQGHITEYSKSSFKVLNPKFTKYKKFNAFFNGYLQSSNVGCVLDQYLHVRVSKTNTYRIQISQALTNGANLSKESSQLFTQFKEILDSITIEK